MPDVVSFDELVATRAGSDPDFRAALLGDAIEAFAAGDPALGKRLMRDCISASVGFERLGQAVSMDPKNLMRMFGPRGNPQLNNLAAVLRALSAHEKLHVKVETIREA